MNTSFSAEENRRQAVRVNDRILLAVRPMEQQQYETIRDSYSRGISLYNQESLRDIYLYLGAHNALAKIEEKDEDMADFLRHLDNKLNTILAAVSDKPSPMEPFTALDVNISGSGLAFPSDTIYSPDQVVEVQIILLPDHIHIYTVSRVVKSEPPADPGQPGQTAVEFELIMDSDRETLISHIFRRQQLALRNRRLRREHGDLAEQGPPESEG